MEIKVSVIVPVYNVEEYLNQCLDSVLGQTYQNIEIIVINDGSTDRSGDICAERAKREGFIYISKKNEGLGPTRNLGIKMASGEYVLFVDSDDWLALDAVEKMVSNVDGNCVDFVALSRYFEFDHKTGKIREIQQNKVIEMQSTESEVFRRLYLLYGFVIMWGKLFLRDFLLKNEIEMPAIPHEDNAVFAETVFMAKNIRFYEEPLYYYRVNREGNIQSRITHYEYMSDACGNFLEYFIQRGMLKDHYPVMKHYVETRLKWVYDSYCKCESDVEKREVLYDKFMRFHRQYFGGLKPCWEYKFALFGSFGSRWVIHHLAVDAGQLAYHQPFSSLIAQMSQGSAKQYRIRNQNEFRYEKIRDDIEGNFIPLSESHCTEIAFFFVDFMEERHDVAELDDGNYITISEAFKDSFVKGLNIRRVVEAGTLEHYGIWKQSCIKFASLLKKKYRSQQIILIKSRLAAQYQEGDMLVDYPNKEIIKKQNAMIEKMENFFLDLMENQVQTYSYPEKLYTEENFRMGIEPHYLGNSFYLEMKMGISVNFDCSLQ